MALDDPAVHAELFAAGGQDDVARAKPLGRDLDLDTARGLDPGKSLVLDDLAEEPPPSAGKLLLVLRFQS